MKEDKKRPIYDPKLPQFAVRQTKKNHEIVDEKFYVEMISYTLLRTNERKLTSQVQRIYVFLECCPAEREQRR